MNQMLSEGLLEVGGWRGSREIDIGWSVWMKTLSTAISIITTKKPHNKVASYYGKKKSV